MSIDAWDEVRTAYHVARLGTVSGAADVLGVHHATVIRHIDSLEKRLGSKLFQRHARGYTPTEAGRDLLQVAQTTEDQFTQLAGRIRGQGEAVSGELTVTTLTIVSPMITPSIAAFQRANPGLKVRFLTGTRLFRLEYGEAHVAIRAGTAPDQPDNVVQPLVTLQTALYASRDYIKDRGRPQSDADLAGHDFIGEDGDESPAPFLKWLRGAVPPERITWRASDPDLTADAVRAGAGLGFLPVGVGARDPDLVEILPPRPEWSAPLWIVTHVDLHRTTKVQAFLAHVKAAAKDWHRI
jgi:DNA-binding transcriptional LysR family regulator